MLRRPPRSTLFPYRRSSDLSGFEQPVQQVIRTEMQQYTDEMRTDVHGNVIAALNPGGRPRVMRSEEHTSELQSRQYLVCRLLLEKKKKHALRTLIHVSNESD